VSFVLSVVLPLINPRRFFRLAIFAAWAVLPFFAHAQGQGMAREIPEPLRAWEGWATWDDIDRNCPTSYQDAAKHLCFWPSRLALDVGGDSGRFELGVRGQRHLAP
jgi:hypothetical protein